MDADLSPDDPAVLLVLAAWWERHPNSIRVRAPVWWVFELAISGEG